MPEKEFLGNSMQQWGVFTLYIAGSYIVMKIVSLSAKKCIRSLVKKTQTKFDDIIYYSVTPPFLFAIMLFGIWMAIQHLTYSNDLSEIINSIYKILITLNVTWLLARFTGEITQYYWNSNTNGTRYKMIPIVKRTLLIFVWIIGAITALHNVGVNISALLGTLGIGGIAFALAAQDTVKNVFGAFTILADKPFSIGDIIRIDEFEGTIIDIGIRSTKLQSYDKRIVSFPNHKVSDASIVNISSEDMYRRVTVKLGLTYDTTPEKMNKAMEILKTMPDKVDHVKKEDIVVFFSEFADSALIITFIYFIEKNGGVASVTSNVNMEILTSFNKAGLNFAFPSKTIYMA